MEILDIKRPYIIVAIVSLNILSLNCFSQNILKPLIEFKEINYKKAYHITDNVVLSVKNISNRPLYYIIGREFYDRERKTWIEFNMDIKKDPSLDEAGQYEIIKAHKLLLITANLLKTAGKPGTKHGKSPRTLLSEVP